MKGGIKKSDDSLSEQSLPGKFLAQHIVKKENESMMLRLENKIELF